MCVQHREEGANEPAGIFSYQDDLGGETLAREGKREGGEREERIMADKDRVLYGRLAFRKAADKRRTGCTRETWIQREGESGRKRV